MDAAALRAVLDSARGYDGSGKYVRDMTNYIGAQKYALREYLKANKQRGRPIHMQDGSIGYGKYRRLRRRGRGNYVLSGIGGAAKTLAKNVFGLGKYRRGRRVRRGRGAYGDGVVTQEIPIFANPEANDGPVTIRHREYIKDVLGYRNFNLHTSLAINPGMSTTFPWLSQIAQNFSQYRFEGLSFHFVSTSGNVSSSQALGEITMSVDYDPSDATITTKREMLAIPFSTSKVPAVDAECPVECAPSQTIGNGLLNVRGAGVLNDLRFYDMGSFNMASSGNYSDGTALGELWVSYQVALYKPQMSSMAAGGKSADVGPWMFMQDPSASIHVWGTLMNTQLLAMDGPDSITTPCQILPIRGAWDSDALFFPNLNTESSYELEVEWVGSSDVAIPDFFGLSDPKISFVDINGHPTAALSNEYPNGPASSPVSYPNLERPILQSPEGGEETSILNVKISFVPVVSNVYITITKTASYILPHGGWGMFCLTSNKRTHL